MRWLSQCVRMSLIVNYCFITIRSQMRGIHISSQDLKLPFSSRKDLKMEVCLEICLDEDDVRARVRIKEGFPVPP